MIFTCVGANKGYILAQDEKGGLLETQTIKTIDFCVSYKIFDHVSRSITINRFSNQLW